MSSLRRRRAQLRQCLEQLKKQVPLSPDSVRNTTLNLLRRAQLHIKVRTKAGCRLTARLLRSASEPDSLHIRRSCRSRTSWPSSWRTACAGSRGSCGFGWSSCREAPRGWGTTATARPCPRRGRIRTEVSRPSPVISAFFLKKNI